MIADVAVLKRLPRRLDVLTYDVPNELIVARGDLVIVPFRSLEVYGIIVRASHEHRQALKPIHAVVSRHFVSDEYLSVMERLAEDLVQSFSAVLYSSIVIPKKTSVFNAVEANTEVLHRRSLKIRSSEIAFIREVVSMARDKVYLAGQVTDFTQVAAIIDGLRNGNGQLLVLVPHHHDGEAFSGVLGMPFFDTTLKPKIRAQLCEGWRTGVIKEMITTRLGALLHAHNLERGIIVRSGSAEHVQYDRNPRYDAREVLASSCKRLLSLDVLPRLADMTKSEKTLFLPNELKAQTEVIDLKYERGKEFFLLTVSLLTKTREALQSGKNVLLFYNRKGISRALECHDCGWISDNGKLTHEHCPNCQSLRLTQRGIGNQLVQKALMRLIPDVPILRSELGVKYEDPHIPHIVLATQYHLESVLDPFDLADIGLVAELRADLGLLDTRYTALERLAQRLWLLRGIAWRAKAKFIVQSFDAQLARRMLDEPERFLRDELELRKRFLYPPFKNIYRVGGKLVRPNETEILVLKEQPDSVIIERNPEL
ncbi:MAG: hypothetical protein AAB337_01180 [Patescibacteria group bacterium]